MNILLVSHFFPPKRNAGTENFTYALARELLRRDHRVTVICADEWENGTKYWNQVTDELLDDIRVIRINLNWTKAQNPNRVIYDSQEVEKWIDSFLVKEKPDVVHVTSLITLGVGVMRSTRKAHIPLILTLTDFWFLCPRVILVKGDGQLCDGQKSAWDCLDCLLYSSKLYNFTQNWLTSGLQRKLWVGISQSSVLGKFRGIRGMALNMNERKKLLYEAIQYPDYIFAPTHFVQNKFMEVGFSSQIGYLPPLSDLSWISDYHGKSESPFFRIGYIGQIQPLKGIHILIKAYQNAKFASRAHLDIWGDFTQNPTYVNEIQNMIDRTHSINLKGRFERDQLAKVLSEIDVLVVPSVWYENAPQVIQEAFATKTPVIATDLEGLSEVVHHEINGLLFRQGDANDLSRQLQRIVEEPGLLERLKNGIPRIKTVEENVKELELIYRNLLEKMHDGFNRLELE